MYEDFQVLLEKSYLLTESLERKYYNLADEIITTAPFVYEYMEKNTALIKIKFIIFPMG